MDVITPRATLPISVADLKKHLVIDAEWNDDNSYLESLLHSAADFYERSTKRTLLQTTYEVIGRPCRKGRVYLYTHPIQSISGVWTIDDNGVATEVEDYQKMIYTFPSWVQLSGVPSGTTGIRVRFVAGQPNVAGLLPLDVHAVKFIAAHLFENRQPVSVNAGVMSREIPLAASSIIARRKLEVFV